MALVEARSVLTAQRVSEIVARRVVGVGLPVITVALDGWYSLPSPTIPPANVMCTIVKQAFPPMVLA